MKASHDKFYNSSVELAVDAILNAVSCGLIGDALDDRLELRFLGDFVPGSPKCQKLYASLQLSRLGGRRKWKEQSVSDSSRSKGQLHIGPDKTLPMDFATWCPSSTKLLYNRLDEASRSGSKEHWYSIC